METDDGDVISRFPGVIAIALPAYWIAHALGQADSMTVVPGALTAATASALALMLMFLALRTQLSERRSAAAVAVLGFATPVWTVAADAVWPHTVTLLGIAGMAWGCATRRWWAVGLFGGITLWGRLHAAVIVAVLGARPGLATEEPVDHPGHRLDQRGLPRSAVPLDEVDVRHVEPYRLLQRRRLRRRAPGPREAHQPAGHVGRLRPGHLRVDADHAAHGSRCRAGAGATCPTGLAPCWSAGWSTRCSRRC